MSDDGWLKRFHDGDRPTLEACYRDHFEVVAAAVGNLSSAVERETAVHQVFYRLLSERAFRESFRGGSLAAWLTTVAHNQATDQLRREQRVPMLPLSAAQMVSTPAHSERVEARLLLERFQRDVLPPRWAAVFRARFLEQRDQRDAAQRLGIARTTLAYQELRIRSLLRRFFLEGAP